MPSSDFSGTKVALINGNKVLTILRDNKPGINFPGMWDFPGGECEAGETPIQVACREIKEELNIDLKPDEIVWHKQYPAAADPSKVAVFMVFKLSDDDIKQVIFGDEGQEWKMVELEEFLSNDQAVPGMQKRLHDYLVIAGGLR